MPGPTTHSLSKNLWFRVAVPARLRQKVGRREIKFSLGTSDPALAKIRQDQVLARWRARFLELDREIAQALSRAPALVDGFLEALAQRNGDYNGVLYGIQKFIVLRLFSAWGHEEFSQRKADRVFGFMPDAEAWRASDLGADARIGGEDSVGGNLPDHARKSRLQLNSEARSAHSRIMAEAWWEGGLIQP